MRPGCGPGAEIVEGVNIPDLDLIPPARLFCNRFKYYIEAYLSSLGPRAPVGTLAEIRASQKFHPSIEKRMLDAQAEPSPGIMLGRRTITTLVIRSLRRLRASLIAGYFSDSGESRSS